MKRLADKAVVIGAGSALQSAGNALITIVLTRLFATPEELGAYRQVWLLVQTFLPFFLMGLPHAYYFYLPGLPRDQWPRFVWRTLAMLTVAGGVFSLGIFLFPDEIARGLGNPELGPTLRDFALYPLFTLPAMLLFPFQVAAQRDVRATVINLVFFLAQSFLIILMLLAGFDLRETLRACVVLAAFRFVQSIYEFHRGMQEDVASAVGMGEPVGSPLSAGAADPVSDAGRDRPAALRNQTAPSLRGALTYSLPAGLSNVATTVGQRLDRFVVSASLGTAAFGVYSVGSVEFPGIVLVANSSSTVMRPQISRLFHEGKKDEILRFFMESCRKQAVLVVPMVVFLSIYAREFISVLYTSAYVDGATVFQIFLLVGLTRIVSYGVILTSVGRTRTVLWGTLGFLAINLGLSLWWVRAFGMIGPPLATLAGTLALSGYFVVQCSRYLERPWTSLVPSAMLARSFVIAGVAGAASWAVRLLHVADLLTLLLAGVVFSVVYVAIGVRVRWIQSDDLALVRRWITLRPMRARHRG